MMKYAELELELELDCLSSCCTVVQASLPADHSGGGVPGRLLAEASGGTIDGNANYREREITDLLCRGFRSRFYSSYWNYCEEYRRSTVTRVYAIRSKVYVK